MPLVSSKISLYNVLYTLQCHKKNKTWHDGNIRFYHHNKKLVLSDALTNTTILEDFFRPEIRVGMIERIGSVLVDFEEYVQDIQREVNIGKDPVKKELADQKLPVSNYDGQFLKSAYVNRRRKMKYIPLPVPKTKIMKLHGPPRPIQLPASVLAQLEEKKQLSQQTATEPSKSSEHRPEPPIKKELEENSFADKENEPVRVKSEPTEVKLEPDLPLRSMLDPEKKRLLEDTDFSDLLSQSSETDPVKHEDMLDLRGLAQAPSYNG